LKSPHRWAFPGRSSFTSDACGSCCAALLLCVVQPASAGDLLYPCVNPHTCGPPSTACIPAAAVCTATTSSMWCEPTGVRCYRYESNNVTIISCSSGPGEPCGIRTVTCGYWYSDPSPLCLQLTVQCTDFLCYCNHLLVKEQDTTCVPP
jgi:hypothetical protein